MTASPNFTSCFQNVLHRIPLDLRGVVDAQGNQVTDVTQAVGLTYQVCTTACGSGSELVDWHEFSLQFAAWLLPCFAFISQLPFGSEDPLNNFIAIILTLGSPMLAAYSLALSVTSYRSIVKRSRWSDHPRGQAAARLASSLQHFSFSLPREEHVLPSLIVLRGNDGWWQRLDDGLDCKSQWTLSTIVSMVVVASAYAITWIERVETKVYWSGWQSAGSLCLSLLPIVTCYRQLSPKSNLNQVKRALRDANRYYHVATETGPDPVRGSQTIIIKEESQDDVYEDEICSAPIYFYARVFSWLQEFRLLADTFDAASQNSLNSNGSAAVRLTREQVIQICALPSDKLGTQRQLDSFNIFIIPALLAFFLQWGITGPTVMIYYLTPTKGLDCHSVSQMLYGFLATLVWLLSIISSALSRVYATTTSSGSNRNIASWLSIVTRLTAKTIAGLNTLWVLLFSILQFSNSYNSCFCRSSVLGLGSKAYIQMVYTSDDETMMKLYWIQGMIIALTSLVFIIFINLLMTKTSEPLFGSSPRSPLEEYAVNSYE